MIEYKKAMEKFVAQLNQSGTVMDRDVMAKKVTEIVNEIYKSDQVDLEGLQRHAVKLLGAYAYLGLKSARIDAEADIAEETASAARNALVYSYSSNPAINVTKARGMADEESLEDRVNARVKKQEAAEYEMITSVAEKAISLIQSILRRAENERRAGSKFQS